MAWRVLDDVERWPSWPHDRKLEALQSLRGRRSSAQHVPGGEATPLQQRLYRVADSPWGAETQPASAVTLKAGHRVNGRLAQRVAALRAMGASMRSLTLVREGVPLRWRTQQQAARLTKERLDGWQLCCPKPTGDPGQDRERMRRWQAAKPDVVRFGEPPAWASPNRVEENSTVESGGVRRRAGDVVRPMFREYTDAGAAYWTNEQPHGVSGVNLVPKPNRPGEWRLTWDLRHLNLYCVTDKFTMEHVSKMLGVFRRGDSLMPLDLNAAYTYVTMCVPAQRVMTAKWQVGACIRWLVFTVLPFGWNDSPFTFSLIARQVVIYLRGFEAFRGVHFLDDLLLAVDEFQRGYASFFGVRVPRYLIPAVAFTAAGFRVHRGKSAMAPVTEALHQGFLISMRPVGEETISVGEHRLVKMRAGARAVADGGVGARHVVSEMASMAGRVGSTALVTGAVSRVLATPFLEMVEARGHKFRRASWKTSVHATAAAVWAARFLLDNMDGIMSRELWPQGFRRCEIVAKVVTDASDTQGGGFFVRLEDGAEVGERLRLAIPMPSEFAVGSSMLRELQVLLAVLREIADPFLRDATVEFWGDAQAAFYDLIKGSASLASGANWVIREIFVLLWSVRCRPLYAWHPREVEEAVMADADSKEIDVWDLRVAPAVLRELEAHLGAEFDLEAFAVGGPAHNRMPAAAGGLLRYCSRYFFADSEGSAFSRHWGPRVTWAFPPVPLVGDAIAHAVRCQARGALVVPRRDPSGAPWWPWLFDGRSRRRRTDDPRGQPGVEVVRSLEAGEVVEGPGAPPCGIERWIVVAFDFRADRNGDRL